MDENLSDYGRLQNLQNLLIGFATDGTAENEEYVRERQYFVARSDLKSLLPNFVLANRDLGQFWQFIKHKFKTYAERRAFIYEAFVSSLDYLEQASISPGDLPISETLKQFDEDGVHQVWMRALERRTNDPEGAITSSRSLLETVCKHILDELDVVYDEKKIELPELYKLTAKSINLSPDQHTLELFKKILGSVTGVVNGLGQVRNKLGDAHGKGKAYVKPLPRHAELVVNLSGAVALFLVRTLEEGSYSKTNTPGSEK